MKSEGFDRLAGGREFLLRLPDAYKRGTRDGLTAYTYKMSDAKSASRERSPRTKVMWPECGQPRNRLTAYVRPEVISVR